MLSVWMLLACAPSKTVDSSPPVAIAVPWNGGLEQTSKDLSRIRNWQPRRAIMHLHSPWSHDACDGEPLIDGAANSACLADLREALCTTGVDVAYLSDHPTHAADQPFASLFHIQPGDERIEEDGQLIATRLTCPDGHTVMWRAGIEDTLMPLGLAAHSAPNDPEASDRLYGLATEEAITAHKAAGGFVAIAHTEGKTLEHLSDLVQVGLQGVEIFNLHAMFDPNKRRDDLGLDPLSWASAITPFTSPDGTAEPDLFFIAVLTEQTVSVERWDALQAEGPVVGFAGTDAHQNVLPMDLRDDERGDSYRRMIRWFSNHLLIDGNDAPSPQQADEALAAGRLYTAFEILGSPDGLDFHLKSADGHITEMGSTGSGDTLVVQCPTLSASSPTNTDPPEITAIVYKDGARWAEGCGEHAISMPGNYRLRVDIVPHHLRDFLGKTADDWIHSYPWVYTNPIAVQ